MCPLDRRDEPQFEFEPLNQQLPNGNTVLMDSDHVGLTPHDLPLPNAVSHLLVRVHPSPGHHLPFYRQPDHVHGR